MAHKCLDDLLCCVCGFVTLRDCDNGKGETHRLCNRHFPGAIICPECSAVRQDNQSHQTSCSLCEGSGDSNNPNHVFTGANQNGPCKVCKKTRTQLSDERRAAKATA